MNPDSQSFRLFSRLRLYFWLLAGVWTVCIALSLLWNLHQQSDHNLDMARRTAQVTFENEVLYRRWSARHGGVYVRVTPETPPNPYLQIPDRDLTTTAGLSLTLINPAYMSRQVNELAGAATGRRAHLTSLKPLRPENAPDPWETAALKAFEQGVPEVASVEPMADGDYLRLMRPLITEAGCIKCHAAQGYQVGDFRGGISVAIPMTEIQAIAQPLKTHLTQAHAALWLIGLVGIGIFRRSMGQEINARAQAEASLRSLAANLEQRVAEQTAQLQQANATLEQSVAARTAALRDSEEKLRAAFAGAAIGFALTTPDGQFVDANPAYCRITGYGLEDLKVRSFSQLVHPDDLAANMTQYNRMLAGEIPGFVIENRYVRRECGVIWVQKSVSLVRDAKGAPQWIIALVEDITDRKRLEMERLKFVSLADQSTEFVGICDLDYKPFYVNSAGLQLVGLDSLAQACATPVKEFFFPEDQRFIYEEFLPQVLREGRAEVEVRFRHFKTGQALWMIYNVFYLKDIHGQATGLATVSRNITERKQAEETLRFLAQCGTACAGEGFFKELARYLAQTLNMDFVCIDRLEHGNLTAKTMAMYDQGQFLDNVSYTLKDTPCGTVVGQSICAFPRNVRALFPKDPVLQEMGAESYLGTTLWNAQGEPIGLIAVIGRQPLVATRQGESILQLVAVRAAGEMERLQAEDELQQSRARLDWVLQQTGVGTWLNPLPLGRLNWDEQTRKLFFVSLDVEPTIELFWSRIHPDDREPTRLAVEQSISERGLYAIDHRVVNPVTGEIRWIRSVGQATYGTDGAPIRFDGINYDITERKRAEERLRESEARYRAIGESIDYGVWVCDANGRNTYASESFLKLVGMTQEQCSNFGWGDVLHPDDAARTIAAWKECSRTGDRWDIEHRFRGVDGNYHPVLARGVPIKSDRGEIVNWVGINLDISALKRTEIELRQTASFYRQTLESIPGMVFTTRPDGYCDYQSQQWVTYTGVPLSEHLGDGWSRLLHPEDQPRAVAAWLAAVEGRAPYDLEYRVRRHDGIYEWFKVIGRPIKDEAGRIVRWFGVALNIEALKRAEQALLEAKEQLEIRVAERTLELQQAHERVDAERRRFKEVLDRLPAYLVLLAPDYHVPFANRYFKDRFGPSGGRRCFEYLFDRREPCPNCESFYVFKTNQPHHWEWTDPVGRRYDVYDYPFTDVDGSPLVMEVGLDITDRKRAEEERQRFADDLKRSNQELEHFAYVASHDLQEPLRTISSFSQLLARRYQGRLDTDADEFIAFIVEGAQRMQSLIEDLLAFSRVGTRGQDFTRVNCQEVLQSVRENLAAAIAESSAVLTCDPLPTLAADASQLIQLFQNLISNAIKFRRLDEPLRIHVSAVMQSDAWQFSVRDNGIGIAPQYFDRIFVIFQRLHRREDYPGTGIGLAICRKIVERHGGRIWVESKAGQGAAFYFTLKAQDHAAQTMTI